MIAHVDDLLDCPATQLQRVMRQTEAAEMGGEELLVSDIDEEFFDERDSPTTAVSFVLHENSLMLRAEFIVGEHDERALPGLIALASAPLLSRHRMRLADVEVSSWGTGAVCTALVGFHTRGRGLEQLYRTGYELIALMDAMTTGELTRTTAGDLIRGGQAHLIIGQPEGHWLDVKSQPYDLKDDRGQISLALAVARFCNAEQGGLIVVGMGTKAVPGGEEIRSLHPFPVDARDLRRYHQVLERRVFPLPDNLSIESAPAPGGWLVLIDVPPQPDELKPFLVHGAIVNGRIEGAFISIVRRRGEASVPISGPAIHAMLAAGRALLRRGELPGD